MSADLDFSLLSDGPLTCLARNNKLFTWRQLVAHVQALPYGRNANRSDFGLVLQEQQGSCSSKHALLQSIATENQADSIKLVLCMFQMNAENTPILASLLQHYKIAFIPEAHCYLSVAGQRLDVTFPHSNIKTIEPFILSEQFIAPHQVIDDKITLHQNFIKISRF